MSLEIKKMKKNNDKNIFENILKTLTYNLRNIISPWKIHD